MKAVAVMKSDSAIGVGPSLVSVTDVKPAYVSLVKGAFECTPQGPFAPGSDGVSTRAHACGCVDEAKQQGGDS